MLARNRILTVLLTASYLLAVSGSALFHRHHGDEHHEQHRPGVAASDGDEHGECAVCQFMAQKPAPIADVAPVGLSMLVQELAVLPPESGVVGVFLAWQSRAPPISA